ncbi:MAG TPA: DnaJ C-terminal domain-containing protein, partial [Acidimicrobiales bacterium]|nr:DnaJ C-terminal domain-containing protein [Acidimicrobiales bacterium]
QGRRLEEHSYTVDVPAGVDDGSTLRLTGRGAAGPRGGPAGDLYLHLRVRPHPTLHRDGFDLRTMARVTMAQAALGVQFKVETLDGPEELTIPPGCPTGQEIRLRARGVPHLQRRGRGDLLVTVVVETPTELTPSQEELLRRFAAERGEDVAPPEAGLFSRIRSAFK